MKITQELLKEVEIGLEAERFLGTELGKRLIEKAEQEIATAVESLKIIKPTDAEAITELQNAVWRAESFQYWLAELIQGGRNAEEMLIRGDTPDL